MTSDELRAKYTTAYKIIQRERAWRLKVFANKPDLLKSKISEMDRLLDILTAMKDELKKHVSNSYEQPALIDVPKKVEYS